MFCCLFYQFYSFLDCKQGRFRLIIKYGYNNFIKYTRPSLNNVQMSIGNWIETIWTNSYSTHHVTPFGKYKYHLIYHSFLLLINLNLLQKKATSLMCHIHNK